MADKVITLAYRRVDKTELSTGALILSAPTPEHDTDTRILEHFESVPYIDMMKKLARALIEHPDADAAIQRTDRPGLVTLRLPDDEVALFRTDPAEAIRLRIIPPQVVHVGVNKPSAQSLVRPLEAGYETLAETFGDIVYARVKQKNGAHHAECFACGMWTPVSQINDKRHGIDCHECHSWFALDDYKPEAGWAGIRTRILLDVSAPKYFLPRRWNEGKNWVSRVDLMNKYDDYLKEKSS